MTSKVLAVISRIELWAANADANAEQFDREYYVGMSNAYRECAKLIAEELAK